MTPFELSKIHFYSCSFIVFNGLSGTTFRSLFNLDFKWNIKITLTHNISNITHETAWCGLRFQR